ncbi:DUF6193 family natural product biosynthesis protein [Dactylosporangium sp. AC04546]|uniref:DUF6193 family natural product biosynthesis protein n=1 Tax=Dactylosporangium sp. AC04546 TaxID=2862460 RepID=UPI001EDF8FD7|nr:DUF6193 family natural product biosynthesis protein [Dactylosporangium sp. AC04546]WVK86473.1 DUF6193 family natural product biosynthesis protein [Dactylosporangium sp. AC04546]
MTFVEELREHAELAGAPLPQLSDGRDRYGPVAAILFAQRSFASVRRRSNGTTLVTVWDHRGELAAWGQAPAVDDVVNTLRAWQDGVPLPELCSAVARYLQAGDPAAAIETLWSVLTDDGEPHLHAIVAAASADPTLRALRPWVSHGTLHLLHATDAVHGVRRGLAFHPTDEDAFKVHVYDGPIGPVQDVASAAATAAATAATW